MRVPQTIAARLFGMPRPPYSPYPSDRARNNRGMLGVRRLVGLKCEGSKREWHNGLLGLVQASKGGNQEWHDAVPERQPRPAGRSEPGGLTA